jgi:hypothetical protein
MPTMRAFLTGAAAAVVIAVIAMYSLNGAWKSSDRVYTSPTGARVTDAGHNLVGKDWYSSRKF